MVPARTLLARAGVLHVAAASLLFASAGIAGRLAPPEIPAAALGTARLLVGGALLAAFVGARRIAAAFTVLPRAPLALAAAAMALFQWSFFAAVGRVGVAVATLVSCAAAPFCADALEAIAHRTRPAANVLAGAAFALLGVAALVPASSRGGIALALAAAGAFAAYCVAAASFERLASGAGLASTSVCLVIGGLALLPAAGSRIASAFEPASLPYTLYLGAVATAPAYALLVRALARVPAATALAIQQLQPLAAMLAGLALGESAGTGTLRAAPLMALALALRACKQWPHLRKRSNPCPIPPAAP